MIKIKKLETVENVYDITVKDNHNFFADGILVHNCAEIALRPYQFCNLTEMNVSDVESQEDLNERAKAASFIGTLQGAFTDFHYLRRIWQETTEHDALIGVGMTGIASGKVYKLNLKEAAEIVKSENSKISNQININAAARTTCVKPSGTSSLCLGTSSGVHAWHNDYYIRRMRIGKNEPLYHYMKENFPSLIEDCYFKPHIEAVMSFPQKAPEGSIFRNEDVIDFLERVKKINVDWVSEGHIDGFNMHNVSCTASIKSDEWEKVGNWMWENRDSYTGISVLPYDGGTYTQAPFEDCDEMTFHKMAKELHTIDLTRVEEENDTINHAMDSIACAGGSCEV